MMVMRDKLGVLYIAVRVAHLRRLDGMEEQ